jgi:hypothetical protein
MGMGVEHLTIGTSSCSLSFLSFENKAKANSKPNNIIKFPPKKAKQHREEGCNMNNVPCPQQCRHADCFLSETQSSE